MQTFFTQFFLLYITQFSLTVGVFFVYGFLLFAIQQKIHTIYFKTIGWKGILLTAWIGTPVHELSHAIFAWMFGHKIHKISFFSPNKETQRLGYVTHSYEKWSIVQRFGSFFIGGAPLIVGPLVILSLLYWLQPQLYSLIHTFDLSLILQSIKDPLFWIFMYIAFSISSHMAPSLQDMSGMKQGLGILLIAFFISSLIGMIFSISFYTMYTSLLSIIYSLSFVYIFAFVISVVHLFVAMLVGMVKR